jgi:hypothetical protein
MQDYWVKFYLLHKISNLRFDTIISAMNNEEPRSKLLGIKDFTLKSLPLWGNKSPTPQLPQQAAGY